MLKGTTLEPRLGNAPHRVVETPAGMLNSIGLQNPGVDEVVDTILPSLEPVENTLFCERVRIDRGRVCCGHKKI